MRIFLIGFMGAGKTHWGKQVANRMGLPFHDLDELVVAQEGKSIADIFSENGEEYFRLAEKQILEELVEREDSMIISCGGGTPCFFNNIDFMKRYGIVVWLNTHVEVILQRLLKEKNASPAAERYQG